MIRVRFVFALDAKSVASSRLAALCATMRHVDEYASPTVDEFTQSFPIICPFSVGSAPKTFICESPILFRILALSRPHALYLFLGPSSVGAFYSFCLPLYIQRAINIFPQICDSLFFASLHRPKFNSPRPKQRGEHRTERKDELAAYISLECALCVRLFPLERLQVSPVSAFHSRIYLNSHFSLFFFQLFSSSTFFPVRFVCLLT